jgi:hypothetical protein
VAVPRRTVERGVDPPPVDVAAVTRAVDSRSVVDVGRGISSVRLDSANIVLHRRSVRVSDGNIVGERVRVTAVYTNVARGGIDRRVGRNSALR